MDKMDEIHQDLSGFMPLLFISEVSKTLFSLIQNILQFSLLFLDN